MRRTKLYQLMAVVGGLAVGASMPVLAGGNGNSGGNNSNAGGGNSSDSSSVTVVPLNWTAGKATVDGDYSEWNLSGGNVMCTAGSINADGTGCDGNGKEHLSTLYMRYDCSTATMYILVLKEDEDGYTAEGDRWVKIYDSASGQSEYPIQSADVVVDGESIGYEASFSLPEGTYNDVQIHLNVGVDGESNTSSTGKNGYTRSITVEECSEEPTLACSDLKVGEAPMKIIAEYESNGKGGYDFVSGTHTVTINNGVPSVDGGVVEIATFIEDGVQDSDGIVSGNTIQFCQPPVFDSAGAEVCLWSADKDADGNYINIEQVGCVDAEKGKFYAIEAAGEFSSTLEAD